ncbi:hypothetical protein H7H78_04555 [Mycobacterium shinjukuense]|uniref:Uncharacterized protein n=1 Tax=Mycobacterium shinjukuense TaxID=398694 RepID=A0A7I7MM76_9MYCO|nr:hypothetical protein [Mycobacterium shinjukuense]MCV6984735.1 hypothetical protein [Mycobacterium shinjukuense]BBX73371.1 hypothetical protein MSHI_12770 [Mycobacterium shinjukuense]
MPGLTGQGQQFLRKLLTAVFLEEMPGTLDPYLLARGANQIAKGLPRPSQTF